MLQAKAQIWSVNGPNGLDANFGIDMNNSFRITNYFEYGDAIEIENVSAIVNPFWDSINATTRYLNSDDGLLWHMGTTENVDPNTGAPIGPGSAGGPLQTMLPSETKLLAFVKKIQAYCKKPALTSGLFALCAYLTL